MNAIPGKEPITLDVISDVVCPWCFAGKRRLETAIGLAGIPVATRWHPFQLDPTIPPEGKDRRAYLEAKFGTAGRIEQMQENIVAVGAAEGIAFAFDKIKISPNTLDAHRLIRFAAEAGLQEAIVEALFRAYFLEGLNIGDRAVLVDIAAAAGMPREDIATRLASGEGAEAVKEEVASAQRIGVTGVPTFIVGGRYGLVGAQPSEALAKAFAEIAKEEAGDDRAVAG